MSDYFYDGSETLVKIAVSAPVVYAAVILFVRLSGKRTTAQMNNFDWIVAVALGSLVASALVNSSVSIAEAVWAILALILMQFVCTWVAYRSDFASRLMKAEPRLLVCRGELLPDAMRKERVTESEVLAAVRNSGARSLQEVSWLILESDATLSVIKSGEDAPPTALRNVTRG